MNTKCLPIFLRSKLIFPCICITSFAQQTLSIWTLQNRSFMYVHKFLIEWGPHDHSLGESHHRMPTSSVNLEVGTVKPWNQERLCSHIRNLTWAFEQVTYIHGKQFPQLYNRKSNPGNNALMWVKLLKILSWEVQ